MYYPCSENKDTDQLRGYRDAFCVFVFAYAKGRFYHAIYKLSQNTTFRNSLMGMRQTKPKFFFDFNYH